MTETPEPLIRACRAVVAVEAIIMNMNINKMTAPAKITPLSKNIGFSEIFSTGRYLELPNYVRQPLWKSWWEAQFNNRTFLFFGKSWMAAASLVAFLYWTRLFGESRATSSTNQYVNVDPPPKERLDKYWFNSRTYM